MYSKTINPYEDYNAYLDLAKEEELTILLSNTTEAGINLPETELTIFSIEVFDRFRNPIYSSQTFDLLRVKTKTIL